ncbi:Transcriptional regulator, MerR family [Labilithrix luteola]|uniref:Transcriptional regulator, MerR family n=1 Tax=Labilithrix luteola TaxID=1391654 RepID=A0A0K1QCG6_9BACT|nr:MerR family transcriptional regulator [Labilithrix luteola]AKV03439.1 Transcriptional regulator, MerR family [Labilithrix luteola]
MAELPAKLFFRIGEVASLVGVEPHVLRYWEREFRSIRPTKSKKGQRVYSRRDVEGLLRVRDLLYRDGFTIAGAKKQLQRGGVEPVLAEAFEQEFLPEPATVAVAPPMPLAPTAPTPPAAQTVTQAPVIKTVATGEPRRIAPPAPREPVREIVREVVRPVTDPRVREQLHALRAEVEAFLVELDGSDPATAPSSRG